MKGPSEEERQMRFEDQAPVDFPVMPPLGNQSAQYFPHERANINTNNSGNYYDDGEVPAHSAADGFYYPHPSAEPSPDDSNPFAEYAWMADAEEFEKQAIEQMEQEVYLEACFQQMLEEEEGNEEGWYSASQGDVLPNGSDVLGFNRLTLSDTRAPSLLNPNAAEFVPRWAITHHQ